MELIFKILMWLGIIAAFIFIITLIILPVLIAEYTGQQWWYLGLYLLYFIVIHKSCKAK